MVYSLSDNLKYLVRQTVDQFWSRGVKDSSGRTEDFEKLASISFLREQQLGVSNFLVFKRPSEKPHFQKRFKKRSAYKKMLHRVLFSYVKTAALSLSPLKSYSKNTHIPFFFWMDNSLFFDVIKQR